MKNLFAVCMIAVIILHLYPMDVYDTQDDYIEAQKTQIEIVIHDLEMKDKK